MNTVICRPRFPLGHVVATPGALQLLGAHGIAPNDLLARHVRMDGGEALPPEDAKSNEEALISGDRILSSYLVGGAKLWIITEADRASTCLLLPAEY